MKQALVIIDMLNDFYDGPLNNVENADIIIPPLQKLLAHARQSEEWVVVFSNDAHNDTDRELSIWGPHALIGTKGAEVIPALEPMVQEGKEWLSPKHFYGAFDETNLDSQLRSLGVDTVVLTGQHTNCCVRHSAYGAFRLNYGIVVPEDCVTVPPGGDQAEALGYLKAIYGAEITTSDALIDQEISQIA